MVKLLVLSIFGMTLLAESPKSATMYVSPQTISIVGGYTPFKDGFVNVFVDVFVDVVVDIVSKYFLEDVDRDGTAFISRYYLTQSDGRVN